MKKLFITIASFFILLSACGPAAESRERMDYIAKRTSDSLKRSLDSILNDPAKELAPSTPSITALAPVTTSTEQDK